jgi:hypothetical protein
MKLPKSLTTVTPLSKILAAFLFVSLPILSFYLGMNFMSKTCSINLSNITNNSIVPQQKLNCSQYGESTKDKYLIKYTVKSGDTLLSIAKSELKDVSRVSELINLNKDSYPSLSINTPFIEKGWTLYLPNKEWPSSSGNIAEIKGEIAEIKDNGTWILKGPMFVSELRLTTNTQLPNRKVKVGDCIKVIREKGTEGNLISVSYF